MTLYTSLLFILFFGLLHSTAYAEKSEPLITVSGECQKRVDPDRAYFTFTVEQLSATTSKSNELATKRYNKILSDLKKLRLKDVEYSTEQFRSYPHKVWEKNKNVLKGYRTDITLRVSTSETKKAAKIIKVGSNNGSQKINGPAPFVSRAKYKAEYNQCLSSAVRDARTKAALMAGKLGSKIGAPFNITESPARQHRPSPRMGMAMMSARMEKSNSDSVQVEYAKEEINVKVSVSFYLK